MRALGQKPPEEPKPNDDEYEYEYVEEEEEEPEPPQPEPKKRKRGSSDDSYQEEEEDLSDDKSSQNDEKPQEEAEPKPQRRHISSAKSLPDIPRKVETERPLKRTKTGILQPPKKKMKTIRRRVKKKNPAETYRTKNDRQMLKVMEPMFTMLVLMDPDQAAKLLGREDPRFHGIYVSRSSTPYSKFLYLKALANSRYNKLMTEEDYFELLKSSCQYAPPEVLPMLKASHTIQIDEALPVCLQFRVIDACIHIHTMLGDMQAAVDLVAEELEAVLVDAINSKKKMKVISLDLVKEEEAIRKAYDTVLITFDLLSKAPEIGSLLEKMWKKIFLAFQLPLWKSNSIDDADTTRSITLFFAFFVVEALARTKPETVFETLKRDFCIINQLQYRDVLAAVFKYLDYNEMLAQTVIHLLLEDCILLYKRATLTNTRAAFVYNTNCVICNTPITGAGGVGARVFECGHSCHDNLSCGGHRSSCPLCKRELTASNKQGVVAESSRAKNMRVRGLNRVEFGLRRHYGKDQDLSECGSNIFFFPDPPVDVKGNMPLRTPNEEDIIEQSVLFLEL